MEPYAKLLLELGIKIEETDESPPTKDNIFSPISYLKSEKVDPIPIFTTDQLDEFHPEQFGWTDYQVIESPQPRYALDWEQERKLFHLQPEENDTRQGPVLVHLLDLRTHNSRRVHRYSREYRFRWTLFHLVGASGPQDILIPTTLIEDLRSHIGAKRILSPRIYELVHSYLKRNGYQRFYLSIPYFIQCIGGPRWPARTQVLTNTVIEQFKKLNDAFNARKNSINRQRFPKMIYIALRLLSSVGIDPPYKISGNGARTSRKRKALDSLYLQLQ